MPKSEFVDALEEIEKNTTFMYRAPEMVDPYLGLEVSEKADIWVGVVSAHSL